MTGRQERAAFFVAEDHLTDEEIAATVGVGRTTIVAWRKTPGFAARIAQIVADLRAAIIAEGIANKQNRIDKLVARHNLMEQVIAERGKAGGNAPGTGTGLLVRSYKAVGIGPDMTLMEEWSVDTSLLSEMRQTEKQTAQEAGQWTEKSRLEVEDVTRRYLGIDVEKV